MQNFVRVPKRSPNRFKKKKEKKKKRRKRKKFLAEQKKRKNIEKHCRPLLEKKKNRILAGQEGRRKMILLAYFVSHSPWSAAGPDSPTP